MPLITLAFHDTKPYDREYFAFCASGVACHPWPGVWWRDHDNHPNPQTANTMKPAKKNSPTAKAAAKSALVPAAKPPKKTATSGKPVRKRPAVPPLPPLAPQVAVEVTHVEIATRAYFIYVSAGRPEGQEMQHWLEAEAQLTRRQGLPRPSAANQLPSS